MCSSDLYDFENFYVCASGLPNYTIYSTDRKTYVSAGIGVSILNCPNHNFLTGEKIWYAPKSGNIGIKTGSYFITKINENQIKLSYSNSDLLYKDKPKNPDNKDKSPYVYTKGSIAGDYFVKLDYQNKALKHQKLFKKFNLSKKEQFFDNPEKRITSNKRIGILANGVEIFSNTTFDDNIYYGKIDSIDIGSSGKDYDVINFSGMSVEDSSGSNAIVNGCITGSLKEVKVLSPGIGYQSKPKITLTGGNGSGAVLESNLVKQKIVLDFKPSDIVNNKIGRAHV